jgi:hypothetical protein
MTAGLRIGLVRRLRRAAIPTQPDEAWCLASEGGRELKVGRELRCHAVGARPAKPNANRATMNG